MQIIVKKYEHFNRSLPNWDTPKGKYIKSQSHYKEELAKSGMKQTDTFGQVMEAPRKDYKLSEKAREIINTAKNSKDKRGNVKLSDRTIKAMTEIGAINKKIPDYMGNPHGKGGFY